MFLPGKETEEIKHRSHRVLRKVPFLPTDLSIIATNRSFEMMQGMKMNEGGGGLIEGLDRNGERIKRLRVNKKNVQR